MIPGLPPRAQGGRVHVGVVILAVGWALWAPGPLVVAAPQSARRRPVTHRTAAAGSRRVPTPPPPHRTAPRTSPSSRPTAQRLLARARALVAAGKQRAAISILETLRRRFPRDQPGRALLVKLYLWNQRARDAPAVLAELHRLRPEDDALTRRLAKHLTWNGKACLTLPLYQSLAKRHPAQIAPWEHIAQVAGWCSKPRVAMEALARIIEARPGDTQRRTLLAKLCLWNHRPACAITHLGYLVSHRAPDPGLRLLLAQALLANKRTGEAIRHLQRYLQARPGDAKSWYLLAQACHWRLCWPIARRAYETLLQARPEHPKAMRYYRLLRRDKGHPLSASQTAFYDSNEVLRLTTTAHGGYHVSGRWFLGALLQHQWMSETDRLDLDGDGDIADRVSLYADRGWLSLTFHPLYNVKISAYAGAEGFSTGRVEPAYGASLFAALWGKLFVSTAYRFASYLNGVTPVVRGITFHELAAAVYSEPLKWLSVSAATKVGFLSDGNRRVVVFSALWFTPFRKPWLLKPGLTFGYEGFAHLSPNSDPYYTPDDIVVFSPGLDVGYTLGDRFHVEAGYWLAISRDGKLAHNPRARLLWWITDFLSLAAWYNRSGSATYGFHTGGLRMTYRF